MSSLDLELLETSFDLVAPRGEDLMDEFYGRFFAALPDVRALYPEDMEWQKRMFLAALVLLRKSLRDLDSIVPKLRELGARHVAYGARPEHYAVAGGLLIDAMKVVAGDEWRPEYAGAWEAAYEVVAATMLAGAEEAQLAA
jgi:hemoglobin-like flavoprotein